MAGNTAARELDRLIMAQENAQESLRQVESIRDTRQGGDRIDLRQRALASGEDAGLSITEGLITGIGASYILGPIGLLLGVGQGILGRDAKQNEIDRFREEQDALTDVDGILNAEFDRLAAAATSPEDLAAITSLQTNKDAAMRMLMSSSPRLQEQGAALMDQVYSGITGYSETQEAQAIEADALDAELRRELEQEQYDRYSAIKVRFDNESSQFEEVMSSSNLALELLNRGTPADLTAALIQINKALDPTSVVRPEEAEAFGRIGNLYEQAEAMVQGWVTGEPITIEQRKQFQGLVESIQDEATRVQIAREARYYTELDDAGVPARYWDNFRMVDSVPVTEPADLGEGDTALDQIDDSIFGADRLAVTNLLEWLMGTPGQTEADRLEGVQRFLNSGTIYPIDGRSYDGQGNLLERDLFPHN